MEEPAKRSVVAEHDHQQRPLGKLHAEAQPAEEPQEIGRELLAIAQDDPHERLRRIADGHVMG